MFEVYRNKAHFTEPCNRWELEKKFETEKEAVEYCKKMLDNKFDSEPNGYIKIGFLGEPEAKNWLYQISEIQ